MEENRKGGGGGWFKNKETETWKSVVLAGLPTKQKSVTSGWSSRVTLWQTKVLSWDL